jgi:hypothetical protein
MTSDAATRSIEPVATKSSGRPMSATLNLARPDSRRSASRTIARLTSMPSTSAPRSTSSAESAPAAQPTSRTR